MDMLRVAAVAPRSYRGDEEYRNARQAADLIAEAAGNGAQLVCLPEGYPGPCNGPMDSGGKLAKTPLEMVREAARRHSVYVTCGRLEESADLPGAFHLCHHLISPRGELLATYRRSQPTPPAANGHLYNGRLHLLPGGELSVTKTGAANIGMIICSEIKVPELARVEMLMGAELLVVPFGGILGKANAERTDQRGKPVLDTNYLVTRSIALTRAVENTMFVVCATNIWEKEARWGACITAPEGVLADVEGAGIAYASLDLAALRARREATWEESDFTADATDKKRVLFSPGTIRERRPDLYGKLTEPQPDAMNYFYAKDGPENWRANFNKRRKPARPAAPAEKPKSKRASAES